MTRVSKAPATLVERYVELWNEPEADARRKTIEPLRHPGGAN